MSDNFYRAFEDRYRGSHELIKQRLHAYDPFTLPLAQLYPGGQVLDLGCGRGEWLELMSEAGFAARGVDLDEGMLEASRARGLDVELAEALETLRALPDATMALVSAFHLVEHLPFDQVQQVIREARRVLLPGGLLILETPNPENLIIGTTNFYLDPSHLRPLPPMLLAFTVEYQGFARHATVRLQEGAALKDIDAIGMTELLEGVSPDYSIVAQNLAPATIAQHFDAAFEADYGISLLVMAQQFDQQQDAVVAALRGAIAAAGASAPAYPPEQVAQWIGNLADLNRAHAALVQQATAQDSAIAGTDRALRAIGADLTGRIEAVDAQGHARLQLAVDAIGTQLTALVQQATLQDAGIANTDLALRTIAASLDQRINEVQSATDAKLQSEVDIMGNRLADLAGGAERARVALEARLEAIEASIANVESQADRRVSTLEERRKDNEALDYERAAAFDQRLAPVALRLEMVEGKLRETQSDASRLQHERAIARDELAQAELRAALAEETVVRLEDQIEAMVRSSSWRATAPARRIAAVTYQVLAARRERRLGAAMQNRLLALAGIDASQEQRWARRLLARAKRNETLRRVAIPLLLRFPSLKRALAPYVGVAAPAPAPTGDIELPCWPGPLPAEFLNFPESTRKVLLDLARAGRGHNGS